MDHQEFSERVKSRFSGQALEGIAKAYWLAKTVHRGQARNNGERYFEHCRRVALKILEWDGADANAAIVALLHDCEEEGFIPRNVMKNLFDKEIINAVETLSKVTIVYDEITGEVREKVRISDDEYFRGIQEASEQIRRIKLCDRLDNLSTMGVWDEERQRRYLFETGRYILPIARMTDEALTQIIEREIFKHYSNPWLYTFTCFECKREPVVRFTLWVLNKFFEYSNLPAKSGTTSPLEGILTLRSLLESESWQEIQNFLKSNCPKVISWEYFCRQCQRFYCEKCARESWWVDSDSWSPPEVTKECPACSGIPKGYIAVR